MDIEDRTPTELAAEIDRLREELSSALQREARWLDAEKELQTIVERYRELADLLPGMVYEMDTTGRLTFTNLAGFIQFGATQEDLDRGIQVVDYIHPQDRQRAASNIRAVLSGEAPMHEEYTALRMDGTSFPATIYSSRIVRNNQVIGLRGFFIDISERRRAEEARNQSEARFRAVFDNTAVGIFVTTRSGQILQTNPSFALMVGYETEELVGMSALSLTIPKDDTLETELYRKAKEEKRGYFQLEKRFAHRDGHIVWTRMAVSRVWQGDASDGFFIVVVEDITRRRQLEEQLVRAQRLEAAGKIAGQVAHDFNNLLGPMVAYPDMIKAQLPDKHPAIPFCDAMVEAAERMAEINENMMALGRRGLLDEQTVNANNVVEQAVAQMSGIPVSLTVETDLERNLLPVAGSPSQLLRVVANLLSNAREATADVGIVLVKTENVFQEKASEGYCHVPPGEYVRIQVSDNGAGIPSDIRDRIFDAFFTTKTRSRKRGSGLGLSIVQSIVEDHKGFVDLETEHGKGSCFSIYLPASAGLQEAEPNGDVPAGTERILIVDDDDLQRQVAATMLQQLGYAVDTVSSGEEAIDHLRQDRADLLVLDMVMPQGIDGTETYRRIKDIHPDQRAIVVSGFAETDRVREALLLGAKSYLRKPATIEKLARAVRDGLDDR